jgi:F-type H+-transporting ATPase subunit delta
MKTGSSKVARRYAKAMVQLCDQRGDGDAVRKDLKQVLGLLQVTPDAVALLASPVVALASRKAVLTSIADRLDVGQTARNLLYVMLENGRIGEVAGVAEQLELLLNARTGRVAGEVKTAVPLDEAGLGKIVASMRQRLGKEVDLAPSVDPEILGGVVVTIGNTVYDASVRNHLGRLRHRLTAQ